MAESAELAALQSGIRTLWVARFVYASNITLAIYDYAVTFEREYWLVWQSKKRLSLMRVAFFLNRYFPIAPAISVFLTYDVLDPSNLVLCERFMMTLAMLCTMQFIICESMLLIRAFIVWERNIIVGLICLALICTKCGLAFFFSVQFARNTTYINLNLLSRGCVVNVAGSNLLNLILLAGVESSALALLVTRAFWHYREIGKSLGNQLSDSPSILVTMVQDGVLYFIGMLALTVANILVNTLAGGPIRPVFIVLQGTLQSILCVRLIYHVVDKHGNVHTGTKITNSQTLTEWRPAPNRGTLLSETFGSNYPVQTYTEGITSNHSVADQRPS